jgi:hypothetical protein
MAENRKPRELEERLMTERPKQWMQAETLPEPDKQPGYVYRWVRVSTLNVIDQRNITGKRREGWEPVSSEEQPKFQLLTDPTSRFSGQIEIGGLLLCKCPIETMEERNAYYSKQTKAQAEAVDNNLMRQSDPRMPIFNDRKSTTSFGKGA